MKPRVFTVAFLALLLGPQPAWWQAPPAWAGLEIVGDEDDVVEFRARLQDCYQECESFRKLLDSILDADEEVTVYVGRHVLRDAISATESPRSGIVIDGYLGGGVMAVDIDDVFRLPDPVYDEKSGRFVFTDAPEWASSVCSTLAHILAEGFHSVKKPGASFIACHEKGIEAENRVRADYGQETRVGRSYCTGEGSTFECVTEMGSHRMIVHVEDFQITEIEYE